MAETEPTKFPEWASANPTDPVSGQPAIVEPSEAKKDSGHLYKERPPRQDLNWLFNLVWLWVKWFKQQENAVWSNLNQLITSIFRTNNMVASATSLQEALHHWYLKEGDLDGFRWMATNQTPGSGLYNVTIGKGKATDKTNTVVMDGHKQNVSGAVPWPAIGYIKDFNGADYVKGGGNCGRPVAVSITDDTWYHVFLIYLNDTNELDIGFDTSIEGANLLAVGSEFAYVRRIFSFYFRDAASDGIMEHRQYGDFFLRWKMALDQTNDTLSSGDTEKDISVAKLVPPDVTTILKVTGSTVLDPTGEGDVTWFLTSKLTDYGFGNINMFRYENGMPDGNEKPFGELSLLIDGADKNIRFGLGSGTFSSGTIFLRLTAIGYIDTRGRDWGQGLTGGTPQGDFF